MSELIQNSWQAEPAVEVQLSDAAEAKLQEIIARYPRPKSAVMPALFIAQGELGYLSPEAIAWVSARLNLAPAHVSEVASFYTMYYKKPVGRYHIQICRTLPCALKGAARIKSFLEKRLDLSAGEVSDDGLWSIEEVECLGSCGSAPMVQINDLFFEHLTEEKLAVILERIEREKPDLRYSAIREELGGGLADFPRSQVCICKCKTDTAAEGEG